MKERPILFSAPMVRALLAGTKTQTRRIVKHPHAAEVDAWADEGNGRWGMGVQEAGVAARMDAMFCPYGTPGDRLWVRETWRTDFHKPADVEGIRYRADDGFKQHARAHNDAWAEQDRKPSAAGGKWRPSIFLLRWASRIDLEVTGVRVERLNAISDDDAKAEGIERAWGHDVPATMGGNAKMWRDYGTTNAPFSNPCNSYRTLWESINGPGSWAANPWVWVVEFKRVAP